MVNFTNPGILGDVAYFRRYYEVIDYSTLFILFIAVKDKITFFELSYQFFNLMRLFFICFSPLLSSFLLG